MQHVKVITGVERRRRFSDVEKKEMVDQALETSVAAVARRFDVSPSLIYGWKKVARQEGDAALVPLSRVNEAPFVQLIAAPVAEAPCEADVGVIRVHFDSEIVIDFPLDFAPCQLAAILASLKASLCGL